jgi:hypothetical protein
MKKIAFAAIIYFAIVFGAGFLLGPVRVLVLEPHLGTLTAVLCEAPLLLVVMILAARRVPRAVRLEPEVGAMVAVGLVALILQQAADLTVGALLRGLSVAAQLARFQSAEGGIYAALLLLFAAMPLLASRLGSGRR